LVDHELLIAQILGSIAMPAKPSESEELHLKIIAAQIGLNGSDTRILRQEMIRLYEIVAPIRARVNTPRPFVEVRPDLEAYRAARLDSYGRLLELLSEGGNKRLQEYIEKQKRSVKVIR
jgi:hypothetical protein